MSYLALNSSVMPKQCCTAVLVNFFNQVSFNFICFLLFIRAFFMSVVNTSRIVESELKNKEKINYCNQNTQNIFNFPLEKFATSHGNLIS